MKLANKVAIVTGGGRGIGKAIALAYAKEGADLVVVSRTPAEIEQTAIEIRSLGRHALPMKADMSQIADVENMVQHTIDQFGRMDILVNNCGIQGPVGPLASNDIQHWVDTININLIGTFLCIRVALPHMIKRQQGKIINIAGGGSTSSRPYLSAYAAAKTAVVRLTEVLGDELKEYNIQVNAIAPGAQKTKMIEEIATAGAKAGLKEMADVKKLQESGGTPSDKFTSLAIFLASAESNGLSGRLISAVWDDWKTFGKKWLEIMSTDLYTLRRVVPKD